MQDLLERNNYYYEREGDLFSSGGLLKATVVTPDPDAVVMTGVEFKKNDRGQLWVPKVVPKFDHGKLVEKLQWEAVAYRHNAFVNIGLNNALDLLFALASPTVPTRIQVSNSTTAVTAATTTMGGTISNKAFSPAASRTLQTVTAGATYTQADVAFVITKVGLLNTSTDAGTGLYDVIGGTGGSSPYNQPFTIDLTSTLSFSLLMQIAVTGAAI